MEKLLPELEPEPEPEYGYDGLSPKQRWHAGSWVRRAWFKQDVAKMQRGWSREEKQGLVNEVNAHFTSIGEEQNYTIEHLDQWLRRLYVGFARAMRTYEPPDGPDARNQLAIRKGERLIIEKAAPDKIWWRCRRQHQDVLLTLNVHKAVGLPASDFGGTSDPFVKAFFEGHKMLTQEQSTVQKNTLDPTWNEALSIRVPSGRGYTGIIDHAILPTLVVQVYDHDLLSNDFLGEVKITPQNWAVVRSEASSYVLSARKDAGHHGIHAGTIEVSFTTNQVNSEDRGWVPVENLGR